MWNESDEAKQIQKDIDKFHAEKQNEESAADKSPDSGRNFASSRMTQLKVVTTRVFQCYNRDPTCECQSAPYLSLQQTDVSHNSFFQTSFQSSCSTSLPVSSLVSPSGCRLPMFRVSRTASSQFSWPSFSPLLSLNNSNPSTSPSARSTLPARSPRGCTTGRLSSSRRSLSKFLSTSSREFSPLPRG